MSRYQTPTIPPRTLEIYITILLFQKGRFDSHPLGLNANMTFSSPSVLHFTAAIDNHCRFVLRQLSRAPNRSRRLCSKGRATSGPIPWQIVPSTETIFRLDSHALGRMSLVAHRSTSKTQTFTLLYSSYMRSSIMYTVMWQL